MLFDYAQFFLSTFSNVMILLLFLTEKEQEQENFLDRLHYKT